MFQAVIVNTLAILVGTTLGLLFRKGILNAFPPL